MPEESIMWEHKKRNNKSIEADNFTVLGTNVIFKGIAYFEGTVQLESRFEGEIHAKGVVNVGEHTVIRGTITAGVLISSGRIQGNVSATDKVQLLKSAVQIGDVRSPVISIEEGAYFKGCADMGTSPAVNDFSQGAEALLLPATQDDQSCLHLPASEPGT